MKTEMPEISKKQYDKYKKGEEVTEITNYLNTILDTLPSKLKREAQDKGFKLEETDISMEILTLHVIVSNGSEELNHALANEFIFCYLD